MICIEVDSSSHGLADSSSVSPSATKIGPHAREKLTALVKRVSTHVALMCVCGYFVGDELELNLEVSYLFGTNSSGARRARGLVRFVQVLFDVLRCVDVA